MKQFLICTLFSVLATGLLPAWESASLEELAIQSGGRKKPFFTFAVESVQSLTGRSSFTPEQADERWSATRVAADLWLNPEGWMEEKLILINHRPYKEKVGLDTARRHFSYAELSQNQPFLATLREVQAIRAEDSEADLDRFQREANDVGQRLVLFERLLGGEAFTVVPHPTQMEGRWSPMGGILQHYSRDQAGAAIEAFEALRATYSAADWLAFDSAAADLASALEGLSPEVYPTARIMGLELFYQKLHPFRWAWVAYALAGILLIATSIYGRNWGYQAAWILVTGGFALQIVGFVLRSVIAGRAPVTNMYESVIWVAFGVVLFGMILERIYRCRYFLLSALPLAVLALILADTQPAILDSSLQPLAPVLRHNFWLTTHVLSICLGYAAFALALGIGNIIVGKAIFQKRPVISAPLYNYLYRTLQIGVLLLAVGTVLGAFWANYSWGRFWDWDPKETWALVALLSYLAVLHGRLAGWWAGFGLAVGSIISFQTILMAWYGVNFVLGTGLHSYGFGTGGIQYVSAFVIIQVAFAVVGAVIWRMKGYGRGGPGGGVSKQPPEPALESGKV